MSKTFIPFVTNKDDAPAYWFLDCLWVIHVSADQTNGQYSVIEQWMYEGAGPFPHVHSTAEMLYVIEGQLIVTVGDKNDSQTLVVNTGGTVNIPPYTVDGFTITGGPCKILNFYAPGGLELVLKSLAKPVQGRVLPPKGLVKPTEAQIVQFFITIGLHKPMLLMRYDKGKTNKSTI